MRTLKFRGRRSYDKQWIVGNLIVDKNGDKHIVPFDYFNMDGHHLRYEDDSDKPVFFDQETIGQYTGQKDKNGKEIFEGDILHTNEADWIAKVIWNYDGFMLTGLNNTGFSCSPDYDECVIIGNIHDNPELIETKNERAK